MRFFFTIMVLLLVGAGCTQSVEEQEISVDTGEPMVDEPSGAVYTNVRFGYAFEVPDGQMLYALTAQQTAVAADEQAQTVFLVENETNLFTIRGIENGGSAHEWISTNLSFFYPTGDAAQRVGEVDGKQALFLTGQGTSPSPARVVVYEHEGDVIVISLERESLTFEEALASLIVVQRR